jgi:hypothetical protein
MYNTYFDMLLAVAAIVVPLGLAGLLIELRSLQKSPLGKNSDTVLRNNPRIHNLSGPKL